MRILVGYNHHPVSIGRMFIRAMIRTGHEVITVGPKWAGRYDHPEYDDIPDIEIPRGLPTWRVNFLDQLGDIDQVWSFDARFRLRGTVNNAPSVLYGTDPHVIDYRSYLREYGYTFISQNTGYGTWIPLGYDP